MSSQEGRTRIAEGAIALLVCAGAYYFFVQSQHDELDKVRDQVRAAEAENVGRAGVMNLSEDQVQALRQATVDRLEEITRRSSLAKDEAAMFAGISDLAQNLSVRLDNLQPASRGTALRSSAAVATPPPTPGMPGAPAAAPTPKDVTTSYTMSIAGTYQDICAFARALSRDFGYTTVKELRFQPAEPSDPERLRATISTEHYGFDVSSVRVPSMAAAPRPYGVPLPERSAPSPTEGLPTPGAQAHVGGAQ